jgi:hypothetical protein
MYNKIDLMSPHHMFVPTVIYVVLATQLFLTSLHKLINY